MTRDIPITELPERALSIRQPWAWAILNAGKDVENRPRRSHYRGPICLHASRYSSMKGFNEFVDFARGMEPEDWPDGVWVPDPDDFQRGGIIGTAEIVDCIEISNSPWFLGPYGLVLRNVTPVPFIPVKGALGLFRWRENLEQVS
ncbi:ASCH domain-containing protein [Aliisedimentitalea scapharcae]|uniref:ASCH domain-containing protein n=1 Tax=Aliisedimentitalea scapharcae TaxID=1524259 RepID=A0ABZ2XSJ9_9RHOB